MNFKKWINEAQGTQAVYGAAPQIRNWSTSTGRGHIFYSKLPAWYNAVSSWTLGAIGSVSSNIMNRMGMVSLGPVQGMIPDLDKMNLDEEVVINVDIPTSVINEIPEDEKTDVIIDNAKKLIYERKEVQEMIKKGILARDSHGYPMFEGKMHLGHHIFHEGIEYLRVTVTLKKDINFKANLMKLNKLNKTQPKQPIKPTATQPMAPTQPTTPVRPPALKTNPNIPHEGPL